MSNTILTPTAVTREILRVLHQRLRFIGTIDRQYDSSFAQSGAKIGDSLKIRLPNEYTVRTGRPIQVQDTSEQSVTLQVATQKGVDMAFTSQELTMDLDDFSNRVIKPAVAVLAANIEADALSMYKDVNQEVNDVGSAATFKYLLQARQKMIDALTPQDDQLAVQLNTTDNVDLVDALKGLFQDSGSIAKQYRDGYLGRTAGFGAIYENTLLPTHTTGTEAGSDTAADVAAGYVEGSAVAVDGTVTGTFKKGDIITIANVYDVHPETKQTRAKLKQFTVTADVDAAYSSIPISPAVVSSGARQNVSAAPVDGAAILKNEFDDSTAIASAADYNISLAYHKEAFAFATADLEMPGGVDFAAREMFDGLSIRLVRQYDINSDNIPCRLDILYGYKAIRPQLACRLGFN